MKKDNVSALVSVIIVGSCLALGYYVQNSVEINSSVSSDYSELNFIVSESVSDAAQLTATEASAASGVKQSVTVTSEPELSSDTVSFSTAGTTSVMTTVLTATDVTETSPAADSSVTSDTERKDSETENQSETETKTEPQETDPPETEAPAQPEPEPEPAVINTEAPSSASDFQREVYRLINEIRIQNGLNPLECTELYNSAAQHRAEEQPSSFGHTRPDGSKWDSIFIEYRLPAGAMGENVTAGSDTPYDAVMQWMNSEGHRANILNPYYRVTGIGYCFSNDSEYHHYWLQLFG